MKDDNWATFLRAGFDKIDQDMDFLRGCLREVLVELGDEEIACLVGGHTTCPLPPRGAQAISIDFQLLNLVEENAAQQTMRARESKRGLSQESGLWTQNLTRLRAAGIKPRALLEHLQQQTVEPVLTAHPTEAKRWTVLDQHRQLYVLLVKLENQMYTDVERRRIRESIKTVLEQLWRTGEILLTKPDVRSERLNVLYYFRERFPEVLEMLDERFRTAWTASGLGRGESLTVDELPRLHFGSWVGGDRDGHPLVTANVTAETLQDLRSNALSVLDEALGALQKQFGLSVYSQETPPELTNRIKQLLQETGALGHHHLRHHQEEPWRQLIALIRLKLPLKDPPPGLTRYSFPSELLQDLSILAKTLDTVGGHRLRRFAVEPVQRLVMTFGFHLARLDIRQNSAFHERALAQLLQAAGMEASSFDKWPEARRLEFLNKELETLRPFAHEDALLPEEAECVVSTLRVCAAELRKNGRAGLGALIVSMTRSLSDLLAVYVLAREVGLLIHTPDGPGCLLPVVPLFETLEDLERSPEIIRAFLQHPVTRQSLTLLDRALDETVVDITQIRKAPPPSIAPTLQIMLGYSDSNKDCGILASQFGLRVAQQKLLQIGKEAGVRIMFFHGRGGTISRGAGPTHRFLEALPPGSLSAGLRATEQGETIAQKFTNRRTAAYNLELLLAGTTGVSLQTVTDEDAIHAEMMPLLAKTSQEAYQALLTDPEFLTFFRQATPIDALEASRIGSRPSRRSGKPSLEDLRAIPWVFGWNQARFYLPGWFGVGSALQTLHEDHPELHGELYERLARLPFLRYVLLNVESGLASASIPLMWKYAALVESDIVRERFMGKILAEHARTEKELVRLFDGDLASRRPRFFKTLNSRQQGLHVLHLEQIRLLQAWRAEPSSKKAEAIFPELLLTVNAIASGLRTTG